MQHPRESKESKPALEPVKVVFKDGPLAGQEHEITGEANLRGEAWAWNQLVPGDAVKYIKFETGEWVYAEETRQSNVK